jgi:hypothetical protein
MQATHPRQQRAEEWRLQHATLVEQLQAYRGTNDFLLDMRAALVRWGALTPAQTSGAERALQREGARKTSAFIGECGTRVRNVRVRVKACQFIGNKRINAWIERRLYKVELVTEQGGLLTWWTYQPLTPTDDFHPADFTVKAHEMFDGAKQTVVQRVALH